MNRLPKRLAGVATIALSVGLAAGQAAADVTAFDFALGEVFAPGGNGGPGVDKPKGGGDSGPKGGNDSPAYEPGNVIAPWMHSDVQLSWDNGWKGSGATITVVDDFSGDTYAGNIGLSSMTGTHGFWTSAYAQAVADQATVVERPSDFGSAVTLGSGTNVINLSYGLVDHTVVGYYSNWQYCVSYSNCGATRLHEQEASIIALANDTSFNGAVVAKAAGNNGRAIAVKSDFMVDLFSVDLAGTANTIFVGALSKNSELDADGNVVTTTKLARYSNFPGSHTGNVQSQFLVVGVDSSTGLEGTSFAAPIVAGYAAIVGGKFSNWTPNAVANQLLNTARTDTISDYNRKGAATYGQGEASLGRALSPSGIWGSY